jgi:all-trans-retinol 13,14-reductase
MNKIAFRRLDAKGFEVISFPDRQYRFAMGQRNFVDTLSEDFPAERTALQEYTDRIGKMCTDISLYSLREKQLSIIEDYDLTTGAAAYIRSVIADQRLCNIIAGNNLLYAGHETKTPLFIHALINHSFIESAWRVTGGSHQLVIVISTFRQTAGPCSPVQKR